MSDDKPANMTPEEFERQMRKTQDELKAQEAEIERGKWLRQWRKGDK